MRRWALALASLAIALIIGPGTPILAAQTSPAIVIELSPRGDAVRERIDAAARLAIANYTDWLGPAPFERLVVRDTLPADIAISRRWEALGQMSIESTVAQSIALAWLARVTANDDWKSGAAAYLESRIVTQLFDRTFFLNAYRYDGSCFFGCRVPWSFRTLPLGRATAVRHPVALVLMSLERELGWPTLQGALHAAAGGANPDPIAAMSDATGRNLAPVFGAASSGAPIDHAVTGFASSAASCATPCFHTQVSMASTGAVPMPLTLRVSFADGSQIETPWQGRARLAFESAAPAVAVRLDPNRVWLVDSNPFNNARVEPTPTNVPIVKWVARWMTWLQDAMLTRTFPV